MYLPDDDVLLGEQRAHREELVGVRVRARVRVRVRARVRLRICTGHDFRPRHSCVEESRRVPARYCGAISRLELPPSAGVRVYPPLGLGEEDFFRE